MLNELQLKGTELILFAIIFGFSQDGQSTFSGSLRYLQECSGVSRSTVMRMLGLLVDKGYLERHNKLVNNVRLIDYSINKELIPLVSNRDGGGLFLRPNSIEDKKKTSNSRKKGIVPSQFEKFKEMYPSTRRGSLGKAQDIWDTICNPKSRKYKYRPTWREIVSALRKQKKTEQWQNPKLIPLMTTWLNQSRWKDDPSQMVSFKEEEEYVPQPKDYMYE